MTNANCTCGEGDKAPAHWAHCEIVADKAARVDDKNMDDYEPGVTWRDLDRPRCQTECRCDFGGFTDTSADMSAPVNASDVLRGQVGGDHYKKMGQYQPWEVLRHWLTPEEMSGYLKGEAIVYIAREASKGGRQDIHKAIHSLQFLLEVWDEHD